MKAILAGIAMSLTAAALSAQAAAQTAPGPDQNPAFNEPDKVAWALMIELVKPSPVVSGKVVFETWATDPETFHTPPIWPLQAVGPTAQGPQPEPARPLLRMEPSLLGLAQHAAVASPVPAGLRVAQAAPPPAYDCPQNLQRTTSRNDVPVVICIGEEVHRDFTTWDYIRKNNLYTKDGLVVAFGKRIDLPASAVEMKVDWVRVDDHFKAWSGVDPKDAASVYYVTTASDITGKSAQWALAGIASMSKVVPNWTWQTFEHQNTPGRCDYYNCYDHFGATTPVVMSNAKPDQGYPACAKTPALKAMMEAAKLSPVWNNYCLKATQPDFITADGLPTLLGNSIVETVNAQVPPYQSSCITCHSSAAFDGLGNNGPVQQAVGAPNPGWFWNSPALPLEARGPVALWRTDFIWAIPLLVCPRLVNGVDQCQGPVN